MNEDHVVRACRALRQRLDGLVDPASGARILGPAPLAVARVNNRYRYRVMIYAARAQGQRALVASVVMEACRDKRFADVSIWADNDPND